MIKQQVKEIMAKVFGIDIIDIDDNATQKTVSEWDSL
jgi:acyl carrier protein